MEDCFPERDHIVEDIAVIFHAGDFGSRGAEGVKRVCTGIEGEVIRCGQTACSVLCCGVDCGSFHGQTVVRGTVVDEQTECFRCRSAHLVPVVVAVIHIVDIAAVHRRQCAGVRRFCGVDDGERAVCVHIRSAAEFRCHVGFNIGLVEGRAGVDPVHIVLRIDRTGRHIQIVDLSHNDIIDHGHGVGCIGDGDTVPACVVGNGVVGERQVISRCSGEIEHGFPACQCVVGNSAVIHFDNRCSLFGTCDPFKYMTAELVIVDLYIVQHCITATLHQCKGRQIVVADRYIGEIPVACILENEQGMTQVFCDYNIRNSNTASRIVGSDDRCIIMLNQSPIQRDFVYVVFYCIDQRIAVIDFLCSKVFDHTAVDGQLCIVHIGDRLILIAAAERCCVFSVCRSVNTAAAEGDIVERQFRSAGQTEDLVRRAVSADLKHDIAVGSVDGHGFAVQHEGCDDVIAGHQTQTEFDLCILHIFSEGDGITFQCGILLNKVHGFTERDFAVEGIEPVALNVHDQFICGGKIIVQQFRESMSPHVVNTVICCDQAVAAVAAGGVNGSIGQTVSGGIGGIERAECRSVSRIDPVAAAHIVEHIADLTHQCAAVCCHAFRIDRQRLHAVCHIQDGISRTEDIRIGCSDVAVIQRMQICVESAAGDVVERIKRGRSPAC